MLELSRAFSIPCPLQLFESGIFIAWGLGINLWTKLWWIIEVKTLPAMRSSCLCEQIRFHPLPCGFVRFHCTTIFRFGNRLGCSVLRCSHLRGACLSFLFAMHCRCHRSFQFSPPIVSFFVILVLRINQVNSSQSSSFIEFGILFFLFFERFWAALPILVHTYSHTWSGLVVVWTSVSLPPTTHIRWEVFLSIE